MTLYPGVAFVTGAGSGIGRHTAMSFAKEGCTKITIADVTHTGLMVTEQAIRAIAPQARVYVAQMDVRVEADIRRAIECTVERFGRIDYAANCAGTNSSPNTRLGWMRLTRPAGGGGAGIYGPEAASPDVKPSDFDNVFSVNARGVWLCARAQTRQMKMQQPLPSHDGRPGARGVIVNVASSLGISPIPGKTPYAASKAAVIQMTKSDALDVSHKKRHNVLLDEDDRSTELTRKLQCSPFDIRVNGVAPGITDTPFTRDIPHDGVAVRGMPVPRKSSPQEIADVILFIASSKASFLQGAIISADGGHTI
ncbi:oxidoreductase, short-chain dehydrogenase/reductase family [Beauveria brongniartii RCEF 3172]|uniref:Oxidoreductase, short-chain dehydrogenase/reductase family n=1 Tax=Beauveria brongniartii RCEF 3172 TaxID=1081107 RepID=A0A167D553_9HYPO|nr:oxidoreductase, short-chain dehydrogenase/reductase family [Beauveria brongniartii RCEF 3172]